MTVSTTTDWRSQLRAQMRDRRRATSHQTRYNASQSIARIAASAGLLKKESRIGVYDAFDGEIPLTFIIKVAQKLNCALFRPRIVDKRTFKMEFVKWSPRFNAALRPLSSSQSRQLAANNRIDPRNLDVVLIPVVAFDAQGWRLGFGAGYYDRIFAFKLRQRRRKPLLIGVGYSFQQVARQQPSSWDVLLDGAITERGFIRFRQSSFLP